MDVAGALRYLVTKALVGRLDVVEALYRYFVEWKSPSEIVAELGIPRHSLSGYIQRIRERVPHRVAERLLRAARPYLARIRPVIARDGSLYRCRLCGAEFTSEVGAEDHVRAVHSDVVDELVSAVAWLALRRVRA